MKNQDKFGYEIYDSVFTKMLKYAKKLEEIGFQESHSKPNLLYYLNERFSVFADMRGYKEAIKTIGGALYLYGIKREKVNLNFTIKLLIITKSILEKQIEICGTFIKR